jgi:hypothetical protein
MILYNFGSILNSTISCPLDLSASHASLTPLLIQFGGTKPSNISKYPILSFGLLGNGPNGKGSKYGSLIYSGILE